MGTNRIFPDPFARLQARTFPELALSAYLPAGASAEFDAGYHTVAFRELVHRSEPFLGDTELNALHREAPQLLGYLESAGLPPRVPLVVFSCGPAGFQRAYHLPDDVEAELRIASRLHLAPVRRQLQLHPPALVVVADKERVRLFTSILAEVEELTEKVGEPVGRHRQGGWSADVYQRREDQHARRNLEAVTDLLTRAGGDFFQRVFLAGPPEARAALRRLLPHDAARRVAGELRVPYYLGARDLAVRLAALLEEVDRQA
jgi:hypothetical protein